MASVPGLFLEYQQGLGVSLCFQGFEGELAAPLPGGLLRPRGRSAPRAHRGGAGGLYRAAALGRDGAEIKRLYVRRGYRGMGIGRTLAECAIDEARVLGYRTLKLDTLPAMAEAQRLYAELGFVDTAPYYDNPVPGARFLALDL